jgi:GT2 family glycosyltransferase
VDSNVAIVVPTFRPTFGVLDLIATVSALGPTLVTDDGSPVTSDPVLDAIQHHHPPIQVLRHRHNVGIARGLNDGLAFAIEVKSPWLLTMDQDSKITLESLQMLLSSASDLTKDSTLQRQIGVLGCGKVVLQDGKDLFNKRPHTAFTHRVPEVIQSGSLWSVQALRDIGGFDQMLGIDAVDAEACLAFRERDYWVGIDERAVLHHNLGNARSVSVLGKRVLITEHSPARRRSMFRNRIRLFPREFAVSPLHALRTVRRVIVNRSMGMVMPSSKRHSARS